MSIAGCRLSTDPPGSAFIAGPSGRPVQNAPSLHCNTELLNADPSTVKSFPELKYDHCDLGFIVIACDVVRKPS